MVAEHGCSAASLVDALVLPIMEEIVKVVKTDLQEQNSERIRTQIGDAYVSQVVEQVAEVPKTSSRDRSLQSTAEQSLDVPVQEMVRQLVEAPKTVPQDRIRQRTVEQIVDVPVPQAVEEQAEVFRVFSQARIQQHVVEQTTPATSLVERIVELSLGRRKKRNSLRTRLFSTPSMQPKWRGPKSSSRHSRNPSSRTRSTR